MHAPGGVSACRHARSRGEVSRERQGKAIRLYLTACNPGLRTYFVNSLGQTVYHRPETIAASRRFSRTSPLEDYVFSSRCDAASVATVLAQR